MHTKTLHKILREMGPVNRTEDIIVDLQLFFGFLLLKAFALKIQWNVFNIAKRESSQGPLLLRRSCFALKPQIEIGLEQLTKLKRKDSHRIGQRVFR